jgi:hypothetical protein
MVVGVFISAIRTLEFNFRENGSLWQIITLRALVGNRRVGEFKIAVVTLQNPSRHVQLTVRRKGAFEIREIMYCETVYYRA